MIWILATASFALAVGSRPGPYPANSGAYRSFGGPSDTSFYFSLGGKALCSTMVSGDSTSLQSRHLMDYAAETVIGAKWSSVILAAGAEYGLTKQLNNPNTVGNSNTQGKLTNISLDVGYDFTSVVFLLKYNVSSQYKLDQNNAAGASVNYEGAKLPLSVQLLIPFGQGGSRIGLEYAMATYKKQITGGTSTTLTSQTEVKDNSLGVVYVWAF